MSIGWLLLPQCFKKIFLVQMAFCLRFRFKQVTDVTWEWRSRWSARKVSSNKLLLGIIFWDAASSYSPIFFHRKGVERYQGQETRDNLPVTCNRVRSHLGLLTGDFEIEGRSIHHELVPSSVETINRSMDRICWRDLLRLVTSLLDMLVDTSVQSCFIKQNKCLSMIWLFVFSAPCWSRKNVTHASINTRPGVS